MCESEVTEEMIEAGFSVLRQSCIAGDDLLEGDRLTVADIYRAMRDLEQNQAVQANKIYCTTE